MSDSRSDPNAFNERDAVFAAIVAQAPAAGAFQAKAGRTIPVIELEPLDP